MESETGRDENPGGVVQEQKGSAYELPGATFSPLDYCLSVEHDIHLRIESDNVTAVSYINAMGDAIPTVVIALRMKFGNGQ